MSIEYNQYLKQHRENVGKGFDWLKENLPELIMDMPGVDWEWQIKIAHDASKDQPDEYHAYDAYFYGGNRSYKVVKEFNKAWLFHIHRNPHHWQYWILNNDEPDQGEVLLEMPYNYEIEMICDWWAFSWKDGNLTEIFDWYNQHNDYIKLNPVTRLFIEKILDRMRDKLE